MSSIEHTIVVLEARSRWEPELQRQFADLPIRVRGCRTVRELSDRSFVSESRPQITFVIDLPDGLNAVLSWLTDRAGGLPESPVIVICPDHLRDLEWALRDAGASAVIVGATTGDQLAKLCRWPFD